MSDTDWAWCGVCKCNYPTPEEDYMHLHRPDKHPHKKEDRYKPKKK